MLTLFSACFARVSKASATLMLFLALTSKYGMSFSLHQAEAVSSGTCGEGGEEWSHSSGMGQGTLLTHPGTAGRGQGAGSARGCSSCCSGGDSLCPKGQQGDAAYPLQESWGRWQLLAWSPDFHVRIRKRLVLR